jgi:ATP-dependent Zn protease
LTELDDEIRRMNNDDYLNDHKVDRTGSTIIRNEDDLEFETLLDRVSKMKNILNKLDIIKREKNKNIEMLDNQVFIYFLFIYFLFILFIFYNFFWFLFVNLFNNT